MRCAPRTLAAAFLAALSAAAVALTPALAQMSPEQLDALAAERNALKKPGPPVALPPTQPERILSLREPLVCKRAARPWLTLHRDPSLASPAVGVTQEQVAFAGETNGFARILLYNGKGYGYLPTEQVQPWSSDNLYAQTCAVVGLRPGTGGPLFSYGS
jgi:hypothetical protein